MQVADELTSPDEDNTRGTRNFVNTMRRHGGEVDTKHGRMYHLTSYVPTLIGLPTGFAPNGLEVCLLPEGSRH